MRENLKSHKDYYRYLSPFSVPVTKTARFVKVIHAKTAGDDEAKSLTQQSLRTSETRSCRAGCMQYWMS